MTQREMLKLMEYHQSEAGQKEMQAAAFRIGREVAEMTERMCLAGVEALGSSMVDGWDILGPPTPTESSSESSA